MIWLARFFCVVLFLGGVGHAIGSSAYYHGKPLELLWALCATAFAMLLAVLNWMCADRHDDKVLAAVCLIFTLVHLGSVAAFGRLIDNFADVRVVGFAITDICLAALALRRLVAR